MEWLKSTLARWKVQVSFVAGALVVATTYGQCSFEPPAAEEVSENTPAAETVEATTTVEVSATTSTEETTTSTEEANSPTPTTETTATDAVTE